MTTVEVDGDDFNSFLGAGSASVHGGGEGI